MDSRDPPTPANRLMPTGEADAKISADDDTFTGNYKRCLPDTAKTCGGGPRGGVFDYYTPNSELITRAAFSPQTVLIFINNTAVERLVHAAVLYLCNTGRVCICIYIHVHAHTHAHEDVTTRPPHLREAALPQDR